MDDTDIRKARNISMKVLEKKQNNKVEKNRSDKIHWEEIKCNKPNRIRGVIVNIVHDEIESFLDDAYFLLHLQIEDALKKYNDFKINTVLCTSFSAKSKNKNFKIVNKYVDSKIDIESWYKDNIKRSIVNKLKQLQINNHKMKLDVICLLVCFSEADRVKLYHQNMQSINKKVDKLASLAKEEKIDFLLLSEHWITESKDLPNIDGYDWASVYRRKHRGGGVAILVSEDKRGKIKQRNDIKSMSKEKVIELAACSWNERNLIILALYCPKKDKIPEFLEIFEQVLEKIMGNGNSTDIIIGGDFNIDFLQKESSATKRLMQILSRYMLDITIQQYTRERTRAKKCIDNIITNLQNFKSRVIDAHISDHYGQEIIVQYKNTTNKVLRGKITTN